MFELEMSSTQLLILSLFLFQACSELSGIPLDLYWKSNNDINKAINKAVETLCIVLS